MCGEAAHSQKNCKVIFQPESATDFNHRQVFTECIQWWCFSDQNAAYSCVPLLQTGTLLHVTSLTKLSSVLVLEAAGAGIRPGYEAMVKVHTLALCAVCQAIVGKNQMNKPGGTIPNTDHLEQEVKNTVVHTLYGKSPPPPQTSCSHFKMPPRYCVSKATHPTPRPNFATL